jgi:hypothetical protein
LGLRDLKATREKGKEEALKFEGLQNKTKWGSEFTGRQAT